jgi:GDP-D-mannose dehydratase
MTNNINKSKIVILGSTGFVGTWLSLYFEKKRYNYLGIGLKENKNKFHNKIKKNINYKYLDIQNFKKLSDILDKYKPDLILYGSLKGLGYKSDMQSFLKESNIALEVMQIGPACRTWSVLIGDGRNICAVIESK